MTEKSPSERRYEKNRQTILEAARSIIQEQGVQALSMRTLAEKADYSASALYKYFENKEAIISALRREGFELSAQISQGRVHPDMPLDEMMRVMWQSYLEFARRYPAHYMLIMNPADDVPASFNEFLADPQFRGLMDFATGAVASGQIHLPEGAEPVHLAMMMWFLAHGAAMLQLTMLRNCPAEFAEMSEGVIDMLNNMIFHAELSK